MKTASALLVALFTFSVDLNASVALGQSLRERLLEEDPQVLADQAVSEGDYARGAVLFTSPKLACSRCHGNGQSLVGPDISSIPVNTPTSEIVHSILEPSKAIREGYGATVVLTVDGRTLVGRKLRETDDFIELRASSGDYSLLRIAQGDIEAVSESKVSMMPADLVDQLKSKSEFLDLLRYVIEISKESSTRSTVVSQERAQLSNRLRGLQLFSDFNCAQCHAVGKAISNHFANSAPLLQQSIHLVSDDWLSRYLADVHGEMPHSRMPNVLSDLAADDRNVAIKELVAFLRAGQNSSNGDVQEYEVSRERGGQLFHSVGCVACHYPRDVSGEEVATGKSTTLKGIEDKYTFEGLVAFLEDPLKYRPSGRMPASNLSHWEAQDITAYLLHPGAESVRMEPKSRVAQESTALDSTLVERGRERFFVLGCANCHQTSYEGETLEAKPLSQLVTAQGCLAEDAEGGAPKYSLTSEERALLRETVDELKVGRDFASLDATEALSLSLNSLGCIHCHQRGEFVGVSPEREIYFQTDNPNLGPQGRIPPTLDLVGAKLRPTWLRQVLVEGKAIRPYVKTRMPQFGKDNVLHLIDLVEELDQVPAVDFAEVTDDKVFREGGWKMVGSEGMNCIACHTFQMTAAANMSAVDLTDMVERLEKDWFYHYMKNPQSYAVGTVMPSFWPGGRSSRVEFFEGETNTQIEAIWHYLSEGRQARTPRGLVVEPMELLVQDEAVLLRRSYPGIGKRGIGVGFPNQFNIVFDAEQMRLGMLWKGRFADPGGVWRSQGHGNVRPLGDKVHSFPKGPDFDSVESPWAVDETRPSRHHFKGYRLDAERRPTFLYEYDTIAIEESFVDVARGIAGEPLLQRNISIRNLDASSDVRLRVAAGKELRLTASGSYLVDGAYLVRIREGASSRVVQVGDGVELWALPRFSGKNQGSIVVEYSW